MFADGGSLGNPRPSLLSVARPKWIIDPRAVGCAAPGIVPGQGNTQERLSKLKTASPHRKIGVTSNSPVGEVSVVTLIRTDTTLDHSKKAGHRRRDSPTRPGTGDVTAICVSLSAATTGGQGPPAVPGLLAMIKCSICSNQRNC